MKKKEEKKITTTTIRPSLVVAIKDITGEKTLSGGIEALYNNAIESAKPVKQSNKKQNGISTSN